MERQRETRREGEYSGPPLFVLWCSRALFFHWKSSVVFHCSLLLSLTGEGSPCVNRGVGTFGNRGVEKEDDGRGPKTRASPHSSNLSLPTSAIPPPLRVPSL